MLPADDLAAAESAAGQTADPAAQHYWDAGLHLSRHLGGALGIGHSRAPTGEEAYGLAWDVYLLYGKGLQELEQPAFWMHQLGLDFAPALDPAALAAKARELARH